jgi:hypothetical protein
MQIIQMTDSQLMDYSERLIKRTIEELKGPQPEFISQSEMITRIGRQKYNRGVKKGKIIISQEGDGPRPRVFSNRKSFEAYVMTLTR